MRTRIVFCIVMFFCGVLLAISQSATKKNIDIQCNRYNQTKPAEKAYLHFDRPLYYPGDTIWYSAYVLNSSCKHGYRVSDVLYVEFLDARNQLLESSMYRISDTLISGRFILNAHSPGGIYTVKAYTNWMLNWGDSAIFKRELIVQATVKPKMFLTLELDKTLYNPGDSVTAQFTARSGDNVELANTQFDVDVQLDGQRVLSKTFTTNADGAARIAVCLPKTIASADGLLVARVWYKGETESVSRSIPLSVKSMDLQFFPEGGDLLAQTSCRVAFKAVNDYGKPADFEADIVDSLGRHITHIASYHHGMGAFEFTPQAGMQYVCKITKPADFANQQLLLPMALLQGFALHVDSVNSSQLKLSVTAQTSQAYTLLLQNQSKLFFAQEFHNSKQITIPLDSVSAGIVKLTLLDETSNVRCERLVYVRANQLMQISLKTDKTKYKQREQTNLEVRTFVGDSTHPVSAQVSIAVVNDKIINLANDKGDNILSYLVLSSEVRGAIHEPSFYFNPKEPKASKALDYLLLTQGWRRFRWEQLEHDTMTFSHFPEKVDIVSGYVLERKSQLPVQRTVFLAETSGLKRLSKVKTDKQGRFMFYNVDLRQDLILFTRKKGFFKRDVEIHFKTFAKRAKQASAVVNKANLQVFPDKSGMALPLKPRKTPVQQNINKAPVPQNTGFLQTPDNTIDMKEGSKALLESVVVGYGVQKKADVTGSVTTVGGDDLSSRPVLGVDQSMQGKVGGVQIRNSSGGPGGSTMISVRGVGTINNCEPLYVVDGVPTSTITHLDPGSIKSISVLKDASACAIYGSRGANGVILITTKDGTWRYGILLQANKYVYSIVDKITFNTKPQFYTPKYAANDTVRNDLRNTVYWNAALQTNAQGCAQIQYLNNEDESTFRITAEGVSRTQTPGRVEKTYAVQKAVSVSAQLPVFAHFGDVIDLPVLLKNQTDQAISGEIQIFVNDHLAINNRDSMVVLPLSIAANDVHTATIRLHVRSLTGSAQLRLRFVSPNSYDELVQQLQVYPIGFTISENLSSAGRDSSISFNVAAISGSLSASFVATPSVSGSINQAVSGLIRQPYGCFEQASSATYPNILAYSFLQKRGLLSAERDKQLMQYIDQGYKRLIAYEVKGGGFSWFGESPANECLTAYGIMEFMEMKKIYRLDEEMLQRSISWLLSRRNGNGAFNQNMGKYGFSSIPPSVHNAYIVWALSEAGITDLEKEFQSVLQEASRSQDPYRMALVILAAQNLHRTDDVVAISESLRSQFIARKFGNLKPETSVTHSYGQSLQIETTALFALGLIRSKNSDDVLLHQAVGFINSSVKNGYFGSTQGTILSLKMLCEYANLPNGTTSDAKPTDKQITISVNQQEAARVVVSNDNTDQSAVSIPPSFFANGKVHVAVSSNESKMQVPYSFNVRYNTLTPPTSIQQMLSLQVQYSKTEIKQSEYVHCTAAIQNISGQAQGMAMMVLGIPAGLSLQPWQLKEMKDKGLFDYYEIRDNYLVIYFIGIDKNEIRRIDFDLKADIPGVYMAAAHSAYLYYVPEYKTWIEGKRFEVK